jgi:hypothetical protein
MNRYEFRQLRLDAGESAFFSRQLEHIQAQTYDIKFASLDARKFIPVNNSVHNGAVEYTYRQYTMYGMAKIISNYADDLPRADVKGEEFTSKIRSLGDSYGYSVQDMRSAMMAQVNLDGKKAEAARRAMEEKLDSIARDGDSSHGLTGFLGLSNTTSYTIPNGASGAATWTSKTPDEIVDDLHGIANNIVSTTKGVERPDTILLPLAQYTLIASKRMGDGDSTTILKHFLSTSPFIKRVEPWHVLSAAGSGSTARMVCYRKDPNVLELIVPQEFEQFPPQERNLEVVINCHMRCGGVVCYYPLAISFGDGI